MAASFSARVVADPAALPGLADGLEAFFADTGLPEDDVRRLLLAFDEIAANIVHHAYDEPVGWMEVMAVADAEEASITLRDGGRPFDPTRLAPPDTAASLDDRPIGGLGILLVRRLMHRFDYVREDGGNRVTIGLRR